MAEIAFMLPDFAHPDHETDRSKVYKSGYPISVQPDGYCWSISESKSAWRQWRTQSLFGQRNYADLSPSEQSRINEQPWWHPFVIVRVPGVPVEAIAHICNSQTVTDAGDAYVAWDDAVGEFVTAAYRLREWWINPASLSPEIVAPVRADGEITIDLPTLCTTVTRIRDGAQFEAVV